MFRTDIFCPDDVYSPRTPSLLCGPIIVLKIIELFACPLLACRRLLKLLVVVGWRGVGEGEDRLAKTVGVSQHHFLYICRWLLEH